MARSAFYTTRAWQAARQQQLIEQPWCAFCERIGRLSPATVVDHIIPLAQAWDRRLDPSNLQSLCKQHHDRTKQRLERTGVEEGCDASGRPLDPNHHWN